MRVTGGVLRGRFILVPGRVGVRPTQDRVRQALFSMIGGRIEGAAFLDLFAGSGAVGIEAWSRGARRVAWVERDRRVLQTLYRNVAALCGLTEAIYAMDVERFVSGDYTAEPFDIIFADPPYGEDVTARKREKAHRNCGYGRKIQQGRIEKENWGSRLLRLLESGALLAPKGLFVIEQGTRERPVQSKNWILRAERRYGDTWLRMFDLREGRRE